MDPDRSEVPFPRPGRPFRPRRGSPHPCLSLPGDVNPEGPLEWKMQEWKMEKSCARKEQERAKSRGQKGVQGQYQLLPTSST